MKKRYWVISEGSMSAVSNLFETVEEATDWLMKHIDKQPGWVVESVLYIAPGPSVVTRVGQP